MSDQDAVVEIEGKRVGLTSLDRVLWPAAAFTKRQMASYYTSVAPVLLPYLRRRATTLMRAPAGVAGKQWFQTRCPHPPAWVATSSVMSSTKPGEAYEYCVIDDLASLLWAVNMGTIEFHPLLSTADRPDQPTWLVLDLDPGPPADLTLCCRAALLIREALEHHRLSPVVKTSGSLGLHLFCPFGGSFDESKALARRLADRLSREFPDLITLHGSHADRSGKVMIDWRQNSPLRSTVAAYSLRAQALPLVSTPLRWEEVEAGVDDDPRSLMFMPHEVLHRVERYGDLFQAPDHRS